MPKARRRRSIQRSALREIRKYQDKGKHATKNLVPRSCFNRLAREVADNYGRKLRFREDAMACLQEATESYITNLLKNANKIATAQGRLTLQNVDLKLAKSILTNTDDTFATYFKAAAAAGKTKKTKSAAVAPSQDAASSDDDDDFEDVEDDDDDDDDEEDVVDEGYVVV